MFNKFKSFVPGLMLLALCGTVHAQLVLPTGVTFDGSDGDFAPTANVTVDLTQAPKAAWNTPSTHATGQSGNGVYDPAQWAVVFKYNSVTIPSGVTVTFKNNATTAPVVWLVKGNVKIEGTVSVDANNAVPGPGGFRGGIAASPNFSAGFGIGGAVGSNEYPPSSGSYGTTGTGGTTGPTYGNVQILPLIGGSGGETSTNLPGVAGGGAILIVSLGTLTVDGSILADSVASSNEFTGPGSGGAIRLVANELAGIGTLSAIGSTYYGTGGNGRIRCEANVAMSLFVTPFQPIYFHPDNPVLIWPPTTEPTITVLSVAGNNVPADPTSSLTFFPDVEIIATKPVTITLQGTNLPLTSSVIVRITPQNGSATTVNATLVTSGSTAAKSTWTAQATLPQGYCAIQAHAVVQ